MHYTPSNPPMNPPHVILHIIHPAKNPSTTTPLTFNAGVMFSLMSGAILLTREPTLPGLGTLLKATKEMFAMAVIVFPEVAAASEEGLRSTPWVSAAPGVWSDWEAVVC